MTSRILPLEAAPLTAEAFAPFGRLPVDEGPGDETDLEFLWQDPHLNYIGHAASELRHGRRGPLCDLLNRHDTHTQVLMPVDAEAVLVVAPAALDFTRPEHLAAVRAFRVRRYECFALHRGSWHWGPYPPGRSGSVRLLNVQGRRYREDNGVARLEHDRGVLFEVIAS